MRILPIIATAITCTSCCIAFGLLCCWAYRRDSRRRAETVQVRRVALPSDTTPPPAPLPGSRSRQEWITQHVRIRADARTARYGRVDEVQWEAQLRERSTS